ncbi:uncharacterized protein C9orf43 homolog isoform X1 [Ursus arctos]|uniref:uncharacterized protein C9orf43 homolog isoform X1 n=1 Tax=Ursus arctos TaxID=9644 RepID=UPI000E6DDA61|nr:uncharacterized protein C9orf43 homolog isoform X1 [Ursus arctos]XP_044245473.1 uncharacterized protein C9orf43 homolog isoform X1 [Ursus arctos]XP_044245475.1 uncharacterized protein C9orf43 homolog isoform X1 [Ursus arctos]
MDLPDESQWDETTCKLAICQHPQCWATIRRIERGHPRILAPPCKTTLNDEDKLPVLTIVNMTDSCIQAKGLAHRHLSGFTFTKPSSSLCPGSKFDSKFQGRYSAFIDGDVTACGWRERGVGSELSLRQQLVVKCVRCAVSVWDSFQNKHTHLKESGRPYIRSLSVLNLNETQLPSPQDVRNMVVIWIPEQSETHVSPAEKKHILPSQDWMKRRMKSTVKDRFLYGKQKTETLLGPPGVVVPPPSPAHFIEQLNAESIPFWNQLDRLPQDLLKDLLPGEGKTMPSLEMKTQLAMMKKKAPLERSRPDSAISARMFLSVQRLALQRPALRYPKHLKKFYYNPNTEGHKKQQQWQQKEQQRKVKTPPKKQEAKKKSKSDLGSQDILHKRSGAVVYGPRYGQRTLLSRKSDKKQPQRAKPEGPTSKKCSTRRPQMEYSENYLDSFPDKDDPELSKTEPSNKDIGAQESQDRSSEDLSDDSSERRWNPELKLLRILQATDDEDEENQLSGSENEESFKTSQDSLMRERDAWNPEDSDLGHRDRKERGLLLPGAFTRT